MIAGKTHTAILKMPYKRRSRWYKMLSPEEKEEAMKVVETARRVKLSATHTGKTLSEETKAKISESKMGTNNHMYGRTGEKHHRYGKTHTKEAKTKMSEAATGDKNYWYGKTHSEETRAKLSVSKTGKNNPMYGRPLSKEHKAKISAAWTPEKRTEMSASKTGKNNPHWRGGKSFEPYGQEFNSSLKNQVRERDNHTCQECHQTEEELGQALDVHHIDYDKKNNSPKNLISLCKSCHAQTNFSREDWTEYFKAIIENNKSS